MKVDMSAHANEPSVIKLAGVETIVVSETPDVVPVMNASNETYWMAPPLHPDEYKRVKEAKAANLPLDESKRIPLDVNMRINLKKISHIDTANSTAKVNLDLIMNWTDPRLIGWNEPNLPPSLWGPAPYIFNKTSDFERQNMTFLLQNKETGRMKRTLSFRGMIHNPMDLTTFPFDFDAIDIVIANVSSWSTLDEQHRGGGKNNAPMNYKLKLTRSNEGTILRFFGWN